MNMKRMMITAATAAILGVTVLVPSIEAAVTVTNVTCKQHYPWNGLVDIDYEIVSDQPDAKYWVYPKGTDNRLGKRVIMNTLSGDGATNYVGVGQHRMIWDAKADMPRFHTPDLQVTLQVIADGAKYLVIDISGGTNAVTYPVTYSSTPPDVTTDTCRTEELWLRLVLPGTFMMGSPEGEQDRGANEQQHKVRLTRPYYIGVFELTQKQWMLISGADSAIRLAGDCRPVDKVSYNMIRGTNLGLQWPKSDAVDIDSFMGILRCRTSLKFDLPTEAQWEYACRAGTISAYNNGGSSENDLRMVGRYNGNRNDGRENYGEHTKVGMYLSNAWGLYDMHGNVWEWCRDCYQSQLPTYEVIDPVGSADLGAGRCCRGGSISSWYGPSMRWQCRSAARGQATSTALLYDSYSSTIGFRVACMPVE